MYGNGETYLFFSETLNDAAQYHAILLTKLVGELMSE